MSDIEYVLNETPTPIIHYRLDELVGGPVLAGGSAPGFYRGYEGGIAELRALDIKVVLSLHHDGEYRIRLHRIAAACTASGMRLHLQPMTDMKPPTPRELEGALELLQGEREGGSGVYVHCIGGLGRTGVVLACYLIRHHGYTPEFAIRCIRERQRGAICTKEQEAFVRAFQ